MSATRRRGVVNSGTAGLALGVIAALTACDDSTTRYPVTTGRHTPSTWSDAAPQETVFGPGGLNLFGGSKKGDDQGGGGIGVNAYLWRATLDTVAFMPLISADPFGGVIITDWYQPPESPGERLKLTIFILDRQLHADGIRVTVFRQTRDSSNQWTDAPVEAKTSTDMENAILNRAREMRIAEAAKGAS
jgi:hypothetical protein